MNRKEGWYWVQPKDLKLPIPCYYLPDYEGFIIAGIENASTYGERILIDYTEDDILEIGWYIQPTFNAK